MPLSIPNVSFHLCLCQHSVRTSARQKAGVVLTRPSESLMQLNGHNAGPRWAVISRSLWGQVHFTSLQVSCCLQPLNGTLITNIPPFVYTLWWQSAAAQRRRPASPPKLCGSRKASERKWRNIYAMKAFPSTTPVFREVAKRANSFYAKYNSLFSAGKLTIGAWASWVLIY